MILSAAAQVAVGPDGRVLALGGGQATYDRLEDLAITRYEASGQYLDHTALPTGPRDGLHARELRVRPDGSAVALTVQYDRSSLMLPVRSQVIATDATGAVAWRVELADAGGPREATDLAALPDGRVLVAVGAELWTLADPDGAVVAVDDLGARLGLAAIEELELLPDGEPAIYGGAERSPEDGALDIDLEVLVLDASGAVRWRADVEQSNWGRERLFAAPDGLWTLDTRRGGRDPFFSTTRVRRFAADGSERFALAIEGADVIAAYADFDDLVTVETRLLSDSTDEEGRYDDFGTFLVRRRGTDGSELAALFLGSTEELGVGDVARMADGRVALVGWVDERDLPVLRFYRLP